MFRLRPALEISLTLSALIYMASITLSLRFRQSFRSATSHRMTSRSSSIRTCISTTAAGTRAARDRNGSMFPRARYFVQRGEWEHAVSPTERDRASYIEQFFAAAEKQTDFLEGDTELIPGRRVEVVP